MQDGESAQEDMQMRLSVTIGGATSTFGAETGLEVASILDRAFGSEGDWEVPTSDCFGELTVADWADFRGRALAELGEDDAVNLSSVREDARGVFLPAHVRAVELPLSQGGQLTCASLSGLREELAELADRWELPTHDDGLRDLLASKEGDVLEPTFLAVFACLALAANEALRRGCPLWLVGLF
jgi:hypothetical protein